MVLDRDALVNGVEAFVSFTQTAVPVHEQSNYGQFNGQMGREFMIGEWNANGNVFSATSTHVDVSWLGVTPGTTTFTFDVCCSYELHAHSAVPGHNIGDPIEGLTAEECQAQCDAVPSCRAVDYATFRNAGSRTAYAAGECILNDGAGYSDHSESDGYMNLDSYIKGACGANQAGDGIGFHNPLCDYARKAVEGICCDVRPRCASPHLPQLRTAPKPWPRG